MKQQIPGTAEFIVLMALLTSLMALGIDSMLPALPQIGRDLGLMNDNEAQLIISSIFFGFSLGQLLFGPVSDSFGRKPLIYFGSLIFIVGCLVSIFADDFQTMLVGRFVQGLGVAGPRVISMALVRDCYAGRAMARIMSFIMIVFIMVPAIAPSIGQGVLLFAGWRSIFVGFIVLTVIALSWFSLRMPETLPKERRTPFSAGRQWQAIREVVGNRPAMGYTVVSGLVFAALLGYLNSVQQIFQVHFGLGEQFPLYFGVLALAIGVSSFMNAKLVMRVGMRRMSHYAFRVVVLVSVLYLGYVLLMDSHPPLWSFMAYCCLVFLAVGILFGNLNALAMEPLGHHAGLGASLVGFVSTVIGILPGALIGQLYNDTVLPVVAGFVVLGITGWLIMFWTDRQGQETTNVMQP